MKIAPIRSFVTKTKQIDPKDLGRARFVYVDISSIDRETKHIGIPQEISVLDAPSRARKLIKAGDVLVSTVRPNLNAVALVSSEYDGEVASTGICVLRPIERQLDAKYLFYFCQSAGFIERLTRLSIGAGYPAVSDDNILDTEFPCPPFPEQQRIAGILSRADRLRRLRRYALEMSESYLQAVFLELFGDPAGNPMGWETGRLRKLCAKVVDCLHSTPSHTRVKTPYPCIRSSDIQNGRLDWSTTLYVDSEQYALRVERLVPQPGDVVYCREGARLGNAAIIPTRTTLCLGQRMMLFRANPEVATPEFIWAMLDSRAIRQQVSATTGGSASPHINIQEINAFQVVVPPLTRQREYSRVVQDFERLRIQKQEALRQAEHLFQTLLHQAFQ